MGRRYLAARIKKAMKNFYICQVPGENWINPLLDVYALQKKQHVESLTKRIIDAKPNNNDPFFVFGHATWEPYPENPYLELLITRLVEKNITPVLLFNTVLKDDAFFLNLKNLGADIVFVDFFLWRTYNEIVNKGKSDYNKSWNPANDKFLFLTGKPNKKHRIRLLWEFDQQNVLDQNCVYSLPYYWTHDATNDHIPELNQEQFRTWIDKRKHLPDNAKFFWQHKGQSHYGGIPYNVELFQKTKFRVISETLFENNLVPWITEKTWITLLNNHPFIMAGDVGTLKRLNTLGFKTFEKYQKHSNYDTIVDADSRMNAIIENTIDWLKNMTPEPEIRYDVEHNFSTLVELALHNKNRLGELLKKYNVDCTIEDILPTRDFY